MFGGDVENILQVYCGHEIDFCCNKKHKEYLIVFVLHTYIKKLNFVLVIKFLAVAYEIEFKGLRCLFFSKKSSP